MLKSARITSRYLLSITETKPGKENVFKLSVLMEKKCSMKNLIMTHGTTQYDKNYCNRLPQVKFHFTTSVFPGPCLIYSTKRKIKTKGSNLVLARCNRFHVRSVDDIIDHVIYC